MCFGCFALLLDFLRFFRVCYRTMIFSTLPSPQQRRKTLRKQLKGPCLRFVGSFSQAVSRQIEARGFDGLYVSGAVLSSFQGLPDIGLLGLGEMANLAENVIQGSPLPSVADADTGFGGTAQTARALYEYEQRGLSGLHIEDQSFPKRCGHLDHKKLVPVQEMILKIKALVQARRDKNFLIIVRTDARGVEGLQKALDRAKAYQEAGADMIFPEALMSIKEFELFRSQIQIPLMANMTEFGKTPIIPFKEFKDRGYNIVIYPVSLWRLALKAVDEGLKALKEDHQKELLPKMQTRAELYDLLNYKQYRLFDKELYNFSLKETP